MNSKRNFLDDDDLLFVGAHRTVLPSELSKKAKEVKVGKRKKLQVLMGRHGAPAGWRGNTIKDHCEDGSTNYIYTLTGAIDCSEGPCQCIKCMQKEYECVEGPPWSNNVSFPKEALVEKGFVGMYDPNELNETQTCSICGQPIRSNGRIDVRLCDNEEVVHLDCISEDTKKQLLELGYRRPYFIRDKEDSEPEGDEGAGECGE